MRISDLEFRRVLFRSAVHRRWPPRFHLAAGASGARFSADARGGYPSDGTGSTRSRQRQIGAAVCRGQGGADGELVRVCRLCRYVARKLREGAERTSVVKGTSVSVRLQLRGSRNIKKKTK